MNNQNYNRKVGDEFNTENIAIRCISAKEAERVCQVFKYNDIVSDHYHYNWWWEASNGRIYFSTVKLLNEEVIDRVSEDVYFTSHGFKIICFDDFIKNYTY